MGIGHGVHNRRGQGVDVVHLAEPAIGQRTLVRDEVERPSAAGKLTC
jgi:hypothetical protein